MKKMKFRTQFKLIREGINREKLFESIRILKILTCFCFIYLNANRAFANNLVIGTPTVVGGNLQFTIQWDNSWNTATGPTNYDAVWVFVKRQACALLSPWDHALLSTLSANHSVTGGVLQVDAVSDGVGVFIRRSAPGSGNIASSLVALNLQTAANLFDNFQVFGIEMVYIPTGDFIIGDGASQNTFNGITINAATQAAGFALQTNYSSNQGSLGSPSLPPSYPQGYNAFYCMKYEISQAQYVEHLNSLTNLQQTNRILISPSSLAGSWPIQPSAAANRNGIRLMTSASPPNPAVFGCDLNINGIYNEPADGQNIACNWIAWQDVLTYLDWSGLRPMTEMEFEKVCRGPITPAIANEYAWGVTAITQAVAGSLLNAGQGTEVSTASGPGLCAYGGGGANGPLRCGFAAGAATTRIQSGAAYYGVMDMSGNLFEQCVGGFNFNYGTFNGLNGDGTITSTGLFNTANWPVAGGGQAGGILRGGGYNASLPELRTSNRTYLTSNTNQSRLTSAGGRGVRTP
jgi:formylglycine-generating enzyme required for sulfatase activity